MAIGDRLKFVTNVDGQVIPISEGLFGGTPTTQIGQRSSPIPSKEMVKFNPLSMNNIINTIKNPAAIRSLGVVPGLGLLAGGLTAGSALINAFQDDDIQAAESEIGWVARSLDPTINLTGNTSATGKHSGTGKFIVFPTYRTRNGNFVKLDESAAKSRSEKLNDFIEFDSKEEADQFVNKLKNEVTERQKLFNTQNRGIL